MTVILNFFDCWNLNYALIDFNLQAASRQVELWSSSHLILLGIVSLSPIQIFGKEPLFQTSNFSLKLNLSIQTNLFVEISFTIV